METPLLRVWSELLLFYVMETQSSDWYSCIFLDYFGGNTSVVQEVFSATRSFPVIYSILYYNKTYKNSDSWR